MIKEFNQSPLPFQGQKRQFFKEFKCHLKAFQTKTIFVDLFGGSGLLSHIVKTQRPDAKVIWNDYDYFIDRLSNINKTNSLLARLREEYKRYIGGE